MSSRLLYAAIPPPTMSRMDGAFTFIEQPQRQKWTVTTTSKKAKP
jgi:hypothetical protein